MKKIEFKIPNVSKIMYDATGSLTFTLSQLTQEDYEKVEKIKNDFKKALVPKKTSLKK